MENSNIMYQQSISAEFEAIKDRVRYFIDDHHWGEDGRYKEVILTNFLRKILPDSVGVGTGFVKNSDNDLTYQIDILIYKKSNPKLFSEGDFVILMPESVLGIIEVKTNANHNTLTKRQISSGEELLNSTIDKSHFNGRIIGKNEIFNGIFSYDTDYKFSRSFRNSWLSKRLKLQNGYLNHICFGQNYFMRYWSEGNPTISIDNRISNFSFYNLSSANVFGSSEASGKGLAFGYFISNLLESVYSQIAPEVLNRQYFEFLYPLKRTKEPYRIEHCEINVSI